MLPIVLFGLSCKKYEEGPQISFISDVNRISQTWAIVSETSGNTTNTYSVDDSLNITTYNTDGTGERSYTISIVTQSVSFTWEFVDDTQLMMAFSGLTGSTTYTITKFQIF